MDARRYQLVKEVLAGALERPAGERAAYLAAACGDDRALRAEVESLLRYEAPDDFLEPPLPVLASLAAQLPPDEAAVPDPLVGTTVGPYQVLDRLGAGGMGVVYRAADTRLGRRVALKFLRRDLSFDDALRARFVREARAVAALDHPNICTLYGIDQTADGQVFLAMAYYPGETLRQRLARGPLPLQASVDIARQVGAGLAAAHAAGVVHRDLKPGNILLSDPLVKVLDFGIAKLSTHTTLTAVGVSLGTAAYTSPEQAEGRTVDHRTDIWALGVVLFEMLTGERPFDVDSFAGLVLATRAAAITPPRRLRSEIPVALETAVLRALAFEPADRFATMRDFVAALGGVRADRDPPKSVAVRVTDAAPADGDVFAHAVGHAFIDALSAVASLRVIADPGVEGALADGIPRADLRVGLRPDHMVGVAATLRNGDGYVAGAWEAEDHLSELPRLLGRVGHHVASRLGVRLDADEERRLVSPAAVDPQTCQAYLAGRWYLSLGTLAGSRAALAAFALSSGGDTGDARAQAGLVEASLALRALECGDLRADLAERARVALDRARGLDSSAIEVQCATADAAYALDWSLGAAEQGLRQVLARHPGHRRARLRLAECLVASGKVNDAEVLAREAAAGEPGVVATLLRAARVLHYAHAYDEAARLLRSAVRLDPASAVAWFDLMMTLVRQPDTARGEAVEACERALALDAGAALMIAVLGNAARARGQRRVYEQARLLLRPLSASAPCAFSLLDAAFGDTERAIEYWEAPDESSGLARFAGFAAVPGSLSMFVDAVGLVAYFGLDSVAVNLDGSPALQALRGRLDV